MPREVTQAGICGGESESLGCGVCGGFAAAHSTQEMGGVALDWGQRYTAHKKVSVVTSIAVRRNQILC